MVRNITSTLTELGNGFAYVGHQVWVNVGGKIVAMVKETPVVTVCCSPPMRELVPGQTDGATEKHVPVYKVEGGTVTVMGGVSTARRVREVQTARRRGNVTGFGIIRGHEDKAALSRDVRAVGVRQVDAD